MVSITELNSPMSGKRRRSFLKSGAYIVPQYCKSRWSLIVIILDASKPESNLTIYHADSMRCARNTNTTFKRIHQYFGKIIPVYARSQSHMN